MATRKRTKSRGIRWVNGRPVPAIMANWISECPTCNRVIEKQDWIVYVEEQWVHEGCAPFTTQELPANGLRR